jgi:multidrug efflux pump subunit AcrA (membrane-fusion protein)
MIRRRRAPREIAFSFDSFLDVVANVVGIILRLILVAWVGARAYHGPPIQLPTPPGEEAVVESSTPAPTPLPPPQDPLTAQLEAQRRALAEAQAALVAQLREWELSRDQAARTAGDLTNLTSRRSELEARRAETERKVADQGRGNPTIALSLDEVRERSRKLLAQLDELKRAPSLKQTVRYRTPVSHPLQTEELIFECRGDKVSVIDVGSLVDAARREAQSRIEELRNSWEVRGTTPTIGAFRMRYVVERERGPLDSGVVPIEKGGYRAQMTYWEIEPIVAERGERADRALADSSDFRRVVDAIDPEQTAATFWVYPDSFTLYRRLRDFLHDRDVTVAGRPLPEGHPIAFSTRSGSVSRGQ